ncbi:MAG: flavodoxin family protein [Candidatus Thermoplasmatota archaeon]|nr:flavodoxin family protein [Candidatus Thermoplasmatota archaeon]
MEKRCFLKEDRNILLDKMIRSDGIIFTSPNYSFQVSGLMKLFLDRLAFFFYPPCSFG